MPLHVEVVSPETVLYAGEGDMVVCRTARRRHRVPARPRAVHRCARHRQGAGDPAGRANRRVAVHGGFVEVRQRPGDRAVRRRRAAGADRRRAGARTRSSAREAALAANDDDQAAADALDRARSSGSTSPASPRRRGRLARRAIHPFRSGCRLRRANGPSPRARSSRRDAFSRAIAQPASIAARSIDGRARRSAGSPGISGWSALIATRGVDAGPVGKAVVHDDEVRCVLSTAATPSATVVATATHPDVTGRLEQPDEIVGEQVVVLDEHHRDPSL